MPLSCRSEGEMEVEPYLFVFIFVKGADWGARVFTYLSTIVKKKTTP